MTEAQKALMELLESSLGDQIEAIGTPTEDDAGNILVSFQYGENVLNATIDTENSTIAY
jgi:hypothetical protein